MRFQPIATAMGLLVLCALAITYAVRTPRVLSASAPLREFSAERAMAHVRQLARAPRPTGSPEHQEAFIYIMARIAALGLEPHVQATTGIGTRYPVAGRVRNIVARIPGTRPTSSRSAVLLVAHYDGVAAGPAAGDDASGAAVLLETLRAIRSGPVLSWDVIALFTDSEESGLLGAAAFARENAWANDVGVIMNFEARGTHGPSLMFETGPANHDIVNVLARVPGVRATSLSTAVYRQLPNDTDLSELAILERPALNFAFIGGVERYHTAEDDAAHVSMGSIQHHGNQALALTRLFASLQPQSHSARGDAVFFDVPVLGIVRYPESWALPIAFAALVLGVAAVVVVSRRSGRAYFMALIGVVTLVLTIVIAAIVAAVTAALLERVHALLPWGGTPQWRGIYASAIALLTVAASTAAVAALRRTGRSDQGGVEAGALVALAFVALYVTVAMPGVSFLFAWPVAVASVSAIVAAIWRRAAASVRWVSATIIVFLVVPTTYLMVCVALGLDMTGAGVLAALTGFACWLLLPHFGAMSQRTWRVPLVAAGAGFALLLVGIVTVRTDARRPAGTTFTYAVDSAMNRAWLAGAATNGWARKWVERELQRRGHSDGAQLDLPAGLARSASGRRVVQAPVISLPTPEATVVRDSTASGARIVTLRVRAPGARSIQLSAEPGVVVRARVDDRDVATDRYRSRSQRWTLDYVAPPDAGFIVRLTVRDDSGAALALVARYAGFPPGIAVPDRPPGILPIGSGDATHVHRLVRLLAPGAGRGPEL